MLREILISKSCLKLVELQVKTTCSGTEKEISGYDKSKLRYQEIYVQYKGKAGVVDLSGYFNPTITVPVEVKSAWVLEAGTKKNGSISYDKDEQEIIVNTICSLIYTKRIRVIEELVHALKNKNIISRFEASYDSNLNDFELYLKSFTNIVEDVDTKMPFNYDKSKYSIYQLVKDLIEDRSSIYIDPVLIREHYENISRKINDGSKLLKDNWCKIISKSGNKERANLNIVYQGIVGVTIPKNKYGIEPGERKLESVRSICLVKDGAHHFPKIAVKINDRHLLRRLRSIPELVEAELTFDNEVLLDLTKLPVISRTRLTTGITAWSLSKEIAEIELDKVAISYLSILKYKAKHKLAVVDIKTMEKEEESDEDKFLHSLGIYGEKYIPRKTTSETTDTYVSKCLCNKVSGIPSDPRSNIVNFINTGTCKNGAVKYILEKIDVTGDLDEQIKKFEADKKRRVAIVHDRIFKIVLGKTLEPITKESTVSYKPAENVNIKVTWTIKDQDIER